MTLNKHPQRHRDHERGATAIMVAASLLLLMGLAAIAVDSGILFGDRRQQASAADVGALAAVQFAKTSPPATHPACSGVTGNKNVSACRGAEEALAVIDGTLPGRYSDADWLACTDPAKPAEYIQPSTISPCIWFTKNLQRARVVLPGTDVETSFGKALGFGSAPVGAFAEAGLELNIIGGVLPFAIGPSGSGSNQACFAAGDTEALDIAPCGSGTEGNFGKLDIKLYGNEDYPTPELCSTGSVEQRMATSIVAGSDHPMKPNPPGPSQPMGPVVNETDNCANIANPVNEFEVETGNNPGPVTEGFFVGVSTPPNLEGRLLCKGNVVPSSDQTREDYPLGSFTSTACKTIMNAHPEAVDHSPLWTYINPGANSEALGGQCDPGAWAKKGRDKMEECIANWNAWVPIKGAHTMPLFDEDIMTSPRFAAVPILDKDPGNGSSVKYTLKAFKPVYLETVYLGCSANSCTVVHSPGEAVDAGNEKCPKPLTALVWNCGWPYTPGATQNLEAVSAFVLSLDMLPDSIADNFPFKEGTIVYNLHR